MSGTPKKRIHEAVAVLGVLELIVVLAETERRKMSWLRIGIAVLAALPLFVSHSAVALAGPMAVLKNTNTKLNRMVNQGATDAKLKLEVNRFLDYDRLAQRTMRDHWANLNSVQQIEFQTVFRKLIEKNYIKGLRKRSKYQVEYQREKLSGSSAKVYTRVTYLRKGRQREAAIIYKMRKVAGRWLVNDVINDDVSMERNYRNSFNRIMRKNGANGFTVLIRKMKKKLNK